MDCWMMRRDLLSDDLMTIFSALGDLQYQHDWMISDTDIWFWPDTPEPAKERWRRTGLRMCGAELTQRLRAREVWFLSGIFSAVPKGTPIEDVWSYTPTWQTRFDDPAYAFQTPLTKLEILCYDGYAYVIVCAPAFSQHVLQKLPIACTPTAFFQQPNGVDKK